MKREMMIRGAALACALGAGVLYGCREGVGPYEAATFETGTEELRQLTRGTGDDMDPRWSSDGDSVYYHSDRWYDLPARGALLRVARTGGAATPVAPETFPNTSAFVAHPVPSPDGERLAYLHLVRVAEPASCPEVVDGLPPPYDPVYICSKPEPILDSAVVRVRAAGADGSAFADPGAAVRYPGVDPRQRRADTTRYNQSLYPYELDWLEADETTALRASWSPDGAQLVFSNGIQLFLWRPGQAAAVPIANTEDGVAPAWSPDGQSIAFQVNERGPVQRVRCACEPFPTSINADNVIIHDRAWYPVVRRRIAVVKPDGSGLRFVTDGRDPAWTPDSRTLYFRAGAGEGTYAIHRIALEGGTASVVPNTELGRSPAVSPDGQWLAFARRKAVDADLDIWMMRIGN